MGLQEAFSYFILEYVFLLYVTWLKFKSPTNVINLNGITFKGSVRTAL